MNPWWSKAMTTMDLKSWKFRTFTLQDGLSSNYIKTLVLDSDGYIWIGTILGLNRYDGYEFKQYNTYLSLSGETFQIPTIKCMMITSEGELLIGTSKGLFKYERSIDQVVETSLFSPLENEYIKALNEDETGVWVGTNHGVFVFGDTQLLYNITRDSGNLASDQVKAIAFVGDEAWIGTFDGVSILDKRSMQATSLAIKLDDRFNVRNNYIECIINSPFDSNKVFIGAQTGIYEVNIKTWEIVEFSTLSHTGIVNNSVKQMTAFGDLLLCATEDGILVFDSEHFDTIQYDPGDWQSLPNNLVWSVLPVSDKEFWVATEQGLAVAQDPRLEHGFVDLNSFDGYLLSSAQLYSSYQTFDGEILVGSQYGLGKVSLRDKRFSELLMNDPVTGISMKVRSIAADLSGIIWLGTSEGIRCYDLKKGQEVDLPDSISSQLKFVHSVICNKREVYAADYDGRIQILEYTTERGEIRVFRNKVIHLDIPTSVMAYSAESLWLAWRGYGMIRYGLDDGTVMQYRKEEYPMLSNRVSAICAKGPDSIIVGYDDGIQLLEIENHRFTTLAAFPDVRNVDILKIDITGKLWISSKDGVSSYDLKDGKITRYFLTNPKDIRNNLVSSILPLNGGGVMCLGIDGFFEVNTHSGGDKQAFSRVHLCDLSVNSESAFLNGRLSQNPDGEYVLNLTDNTASLVLKVSDLAFGSSRTTQYQYTFDGRTRTLPIGKNVITIDSMEYGTHVIEVGEAYADKTSKQGTLVLTVHVKKPFMKSTFMLVVYVLVALVLILWIYRSTIAY